MKKFDDLCQENYDRIYKFIYLKLQNKERTEDAVQTVFLIAYEKGRVFTSHPNPTAFLYITAKNVVYDSVREMKKHGEELLEDTLHGKHNDLLEELEYLKDQQIDEGNYIDEVLGKLTFEKRKLYDAYYVHGKSMDEIAKEHDTSSVTIRMRYVRLRKEMKHTIKNKNVEQADQLTRELLEKEGLKIQPSMPEGFADQIRFASKERGSKMKHKMIKTAAVAAVCVLGVGSSAYAAAPFIQKLAQDGQSAVVFTNPQSKEESKVTVNAPSQVTLKNEDIKVSGDDWYDKLYADAKPGKYTYVDESPFYTLDDGKKWEKDKTAAKAVVDRYVFDSLQEAFDQAGIANILTSLQGEYALTNKLANCYETYTDQEDSILTKSVRVVLEGKEEQKIIAHIDKSLVKEDPDELTAVINGVEVGNYREITTSKGVTYSIQDVKDEGDKHVAANILVGSYNVSLKFYNMSEKTITELLEKVAIKELNK